MTFYRTAVWICIAIIVFTLAINVVNSMEAFPTDYEGGTTGITSENALEQISGLEGGMEGIWALGVGLGAIGVVALVFVSKQISPIGIYIFSTVFWTSWLRMFAVLNIGEYIPAELLLLFTVGVLFIFIAAVIGMLTGSG